MKYICTLLAVSDMERSKQFYLALLGMEITADFGANITLSHRLALQTLESWSTFIGKDQSEIHWGDHAKELYFEAEDFDRFMQKAAAYPSLEYVHGVKEYAWGQRVVRFYDPDRHIIEVGEDMSAVTLRFFNQGMKPAEIAHRMDVPMPAVIHWLGISGLPTEGL